MDVDTKINLVKKSPTEELIQDEVWRKHGIDRYFENECFAEGFQNNRPETKKFLKIMALLHDTDNFGFAWMYKHH